MAESNALAIIHADWTPWLIRAPRILQKLGLCMSLAATREAAQIEFSSSTLEYPDLASNLVSITNQGQNVFIEAYSDMIQISSKTNYMGCRNGKLDEFAKFFGDPDAEAALRRIRRSIQTAINTCNTSGKRTEKDFKDWNNSVSKLHLAVVGAQRRTNAEIQQTIDEMKLISEKIARVTIELAESNEHTEDAKKVYGNTIRAKREYDEYLNSFLGQARDIGIAASFGLLGTIVNAGITTYLSASAAKRVREAEQELQRRRDIARQLDYGLQAIEIDLDLFTKEKEGFQHLLGAIVIVLQLLAGLMDDISQLLLFFKRLNESVESLITEHDDGINAIAQSQDDGNELSDADFEQFYTSIKHSKKLALTVHALASLYANVISAVINPGFSQVILASHHVEGSSALVVSQKQADMGRFIDDAERICQGAAKEANDNLRLRIAEIENERPVRRRTNRNGNRRQNGRAGGGAFFGFFRR